jgi:hypothetical protein
MSKTFGKYIGKHRGCEHYCRVWSHRVGIVRCKLARSHEPPHRNGKIVWT